MSTARTVIGLRTSCPSQSRQVNDLNDHSPTAASDRVTVLHEGRVLAADTAEQALSPETVSKAFGLQSTITPHPLTGRPHLTCALPD
jgi:iron complex transport system ATP-binding protein